MQLVTLLWTYKKQLKIAIYSGFSHKKNWFSIAMLVHQRVAKMMVFKMMAFATLTLGESNVASWEIPEWRNSWNNF